MWNKKIKFLLYAVIAAGSFFSLKDSFLSGGGPTLNLNDSLLVSSLGEPTKTDVTEQPSAVLQTIPAIAPADLAITNVSLKKIGEPSKNFNYYKYKATVVIKNYGGDLVNGQVVLSGDNQRYLFVKNTPEGFSLEKDKSFIVEDYELIFDGKYNGGAVNLKIEVKGDQDHYLANNNYKVDIFELPARIESIGIEKISDDGSVSLKFEPKTTILGSNKTEIYVNDTFRLKEDQEKYAEISDLDSVYSYYRIKNSPEILQTDGWKVKEMTTDNPHSVQLANDPTQSETGRYVYVKIVDSESGNYLVSNVLRLVPQKTLSRGDFAKLFVDEAKIKVFTDGKNYFEDVKKEAPYAEAVQTLYNLGLLKNESTKYLPEKPVTRAEALRFVLDYFDVNLVISPGAPHFKDVTETHPLYPYLEAFYASGKGNVLGDSFKPDALVNQYFLNYITNEYKKNT